jgi:hypothetical protein
MAVKWYVDEGLTKLIKQWKAEHPGATVYTIGDASHQSHTSEHNPEPPGGAPGADGNEVDAADFMPGNGVTMNDLRELRNNLIEARDSRLLYTIIDFEIVSSVTQPWKIREYGGKRHTHLHVSVNDRYDRNTASWDIDGKGEIVPREYTRKQIPGTLPELRLGDEDVPGQTQNVRRVQSILSGTFGYDIEIDGAYGPVSARALAAVMKNDAARSSSNGGKIGVPEWKRLFGIW